jgi:hypothetical protein
MKSIPSLDVYANRERLGFPPEASQFPRFVVKRPSEMASEDVFWTVAITAQQFVVSRDFVQRSFP